MQNAAKKSTRQGRVALAGWLAMCLSGSWAVQLSAQEDASSRAEAGMLGQVIALEPRQKAVVISGQSFRVVAESRLYEVDQATGEETTITWGSIAVGDFVLVDSDGNVVKSLQRMDPSGVDAPPASPLLQPIRDE